MLLYSISSVQDDDEAYGMRLFFARPKYVLRKLVFSMLPDGTDNRDRFVRNDLRLEGVCTQQRKCIKDDLFAILTAICDHRPDMAKIPDSFCHRVDEA